jgi:bifunctional non-homologous end joining protein LigD
MKTHRMYRDEWRTGMICDPAALPERPLQQTLYYRDGSSDKVYTVRMIETGPKGGSWSVQVEFGRRGGTMQTAVKTKAPTTRDAAQKVFEAALAEKIRKGYTPGPNGTVHQSVAELDATRKTRVTGVLPQLLNEIEPHEIPRYIKSDDWWLQEKHDGHRALVLVRDGEAKGINRSGLAVPLPAPIAMAAEQLGVDCIIDGEKVGDTLFAFDLLEHNGTDLRPLPYAERYAVLKLLAGVGCLTNSAIAVVTTAVTTAQKIDAVERLTKENAEGFVLKRHAAKHTPDRPSSGGDWLKVKFWDSASVICTGPNGDKASVGVMVLKGKAPVAVGHVTVPGNRPMPKKGNIMEVRYLYTGPGGHLVQPVYIGLRDDIGPMDCQWTQLKHKRR